MTNLTTLENLVLREIIKEELYEGDYCEKGWGPTLKQLSVSANVDINILRGVLGSLTSKNMIEIEPNDDGPTLYCSKMDFEKAIDFAV